jgi:alanine racemase
MESDNFATWLEIDLGVIEKNLRVIQDVAGTQVMPIIKANAYGHGLEEIARTVEKAGTSWCGVARIEEALLLRKAGISMRILVLGYTPPQRVAEAIHNAISLTVYDDAVVREYLEQARSHKASIHIQVKVDTGMGRLGIPAAQALDLISFVHGRPEFIFEAIFTHFACADEPETSYTNQQLEKFQRIIQEVVKQGLRPPLIHAANSAATLNYPNSRYDIVRCGLAMYGINPSKSTQFPEGITPALTWKTRLISIKDLPSGHGVSYGFKYITQKSERVGVIAVGYADGMRRQPGNVALLHNQRVPVIGNVCMDQCILQLDQVPNARIGDEVVLIGQQGNEWITATDLAQTWGTIPYEVICGMAARMPRHYIR